MLDIEQSSSIARNRLYQLIPQRVDLVMRRLAQLLWEDRTPLAVSGGPVNAHPIALYDAQRQPMRPVTPGEYFCPDYKENPWQQRWFRAELPAVTPEQSGRRHLHWQCHGEATLYIDGDPWAGLDVAHTTCRLPDHACTLWFDCGTYQTCIWYDGAEPDHLGLQFKGADVACRNNPIWEAYWDLDVLVQLLDKLLKDNDAGTENRSLGHQLPVGDCSPLLRRLLFDIEDACNRYDHEGLSTFSAKLKAIYASIPSECWQLDSTMIGHSHLDMAWLWPEEEGERKAVHTFSSMIRLLEEYPEFTFMWTSPANYQALERRAPGLYAQIRQMITAGRWEATGGMWVEPDNLLPCGEALARSFLLGQHGFKALRGEYSRVAWLPDVFGYSACLPQLIRQAGIESFFTCKMTWSAVNEFPHHSFMWRGHDGSEVLTHLWTGGCGDGELPKLQQMAERYRQSGVHQEILDFVGVGDGGGGTTVKTIERLRRMANLATVPRAQWGSVEEFFDRLAQVSERLPVFQGELYLEYHRGTFTTQSELKRMYRRAERSMQTWEAARVALGLGPVDAQCWQRLCFAQFHDIIPGSSIGLVYRQFTPELEAMGTQALQATVDELSVEVGDLAVFNPAALSRTCVVAFDPDAIGHATGLEIAGKTVPVQYTDSGALAALPLPGLGSVAVRATKSSGKQDGGWNEISPEALDNGILRAEFANGGVSALTVDGQPLAFTEPSGFLLYHDLPANWDAWDIDQFSLEHGDRVATDIRLTVVEQGPVRAALRGTVAIGAASTLTLTYLLEAGSPYLHVEASVDWREDHRLLKYHLFTDYRGAHYRCGMPFGSITRLQQPGYVTDEVKWEVPMSRWMALGDENDGAGVAVITEAKYGVSCREGNIGLSLLRAPKYPDPDADRGAHTMRFAIGSHRTQTMPDRPNTAAAADTLFMPAVIFTGKPVVSPILCEDLGSLTPAWVLPAEDGKGFVIRLHETMGGRGTATLRFACPAKSVQPVDLLERPNGSPLVAQTDGSYQVAYTPYQLMSVLVRPA